jgi:hypothetical protein
MLAGPDQTRRDPKRERWINLAFVVATVLVALALGLLAFRYALEQDEIGSEAGADAPARQQFRGN